MRKKHFLIVLLTVFAVLGAFAGNWYDGQNITGFVLAGIKNVSVSEVDKVVYPYRGNQYSDSVLKEIESKLYKIDGVDYIDVEAKRDATTNALVLVLHFHELPLIGEVKFEGNKGVSTTTLTEALTTIQSGKFADLNKGSVLESAKNQILQAYLKNGFEDTEITISKTEGATSSVSDVIISIKEGTQYRITEIAFEGNENVSESILKKQIKLKKKSVFEKGYLVKSQLKDDADAIETYYKSNGYLDAIVLNTKTEDVSTGKHDYKEVKLTFVIDEAQLWYFGGLTFNGNEVFSDEEIAEAVGDSLVVGSIYSSNALEAAYNAVSDLYFNNGYISTQLPAEETRDDTKMVVSYVVNIKESAQSHIEAINFKGLNKTNEKVMRRELELNPGDVFSKAKFTTSAQNLYNTGLLSDIDYEMNHGEEQDGVVIDFLLTEGSTMDIQFGATFGGSATGFPISGFLSWSNKNFRGMGQDLSVSTTVSPTTQSLSLSFGDDWFFNKRWSNSFSFSFSHTYNEDEYQLGTNSSTYDGSSDTLSYPKPFVSYAEYIEKKDSASFNDSDLMDYDLFSTTLGYSTGYTWIYDAGRLGVSGGLSFGFNRALYDSCYTPYREIINKYGDAWQMSNKLSGSVQWDGRDYVTNTTKGYVASLTATTAGGLLGGLSNYNKISLSLAGYQKIVDIPTSETDKTPLMLCASSTGTIILPQFDFYNKNSEKFFTEATQDEMLYIDGMTIARGHDFVSYQSLLWDNMLEISYQLVPGVIQAEAFASATYCREFLSKDSDLGTDGWYMGFGAGLKLKISGFPLGFYIVKNATALKGDKFTWTHPSDEFGENSGIHFVLAISTSLI